jgi:hypothetical protein
VTPATLLRHCKSIYNRLGETAQREDGSGLLIWEGSITSVVRELGISNAVYSRVLSTMEESNWITQIQRGGRGLQTRFVLHSPPDSASLVMPDQGLTNPTPFDTLSARVSGLERRLEGIDVKMYLATLERRIQQLERTTNTNTGETNV